MMTTFIKAAPCWALVPAALVLCWRGRTPLSVVPFDPIPLESVNPTSLDSRRMIGRLLTVDPYRRGGR